MGCSSRSALLSAPAYHEQRLAWRAALEAADAGGSDRISRLGALYADDVVWHGSHPFNGQRGRNAVMAAFWLPLLDAVPDLQRVDDVVLAGEWKSGAWVGATGHYVGTFRRPWLGIPATGGSVALRYGEFARLETGRVCETYVIVDVLDVMRQAGVWPLAPPLGNVDRVPPPMTRDGVIERPAPAAESARSLALVEAMIAGLMEFDGRSLHSMRQERFWDVERMMWYGPAAIGTCRGLKGFQDVHQRPFLHAFPDRVGGDHKCRIGEGAYVGSTGWPSIRATHTGGGFIGMPATGKPVTMRVMDFWRRAGERLVENWVFIDVPDLLLQIGFDVFAREAERRRAAGA